MENQSQERRLYLFRYLCVLLSFHTSVFLSSQLLLLLHITQVIPRASWERGCSINTVCAAKCRPAKDPRKTQQRADDGWKGPSVTSDVLNCQSRAKLGLMPCSLHHPCFQLLPFYWFQREYAAGKMNYIYYKYF